MKKICFVTGTRADYGIMAPIMREVEKSPETELQIIATNMHLSPEFGMTVKEIEEDGFKVNAKIESLVGGGSAAATVMSMAKTEEGLAKAFEELKPDLVVILGDRYEALSSASAAVAFNIPVAHLHGGETTEGAIDDKFRHAITQLSDIHFAATPQYAERIISMGKNPESVFHSGAPGAEIEREDESINENGWSAMTAPKEAQEFYEKTGINPYEPFILLAFHPVTMLADKGELELQQTIEALKAFIIQGYKILVTLPNSDPGNEGIRRILKEWKEQSGKGGEIRMVESLGAKLFHFALDHALAIVGNSSAALIEAPSYRLGAVNVGIRQKGRAHGITVIDSPGEKEEIEKALNFVMSMEMKAVLMGMTVSALNPYYKEDAAKFIAEKLINYK